MVKVFLDTNFLLIPFQFNIDIFAEINKILNIKPEFYISTLTFTELERIRTNKNSKKKDKEASKLAEKLLKQKDLKIVENSSYQLVDDYLVENTKEFDYIATQDKELKDKLKNKCSLIIMKSKKYLQVN